MMSSLPDPFREMGSRPLVDGVMLWCPSDLFCGLSLAILFWASA